MTWVTCPGTWAVIIIHLILPMATMTNIVTHQVWADANEGVTLKSICTTKCLRILESRYNKSEPIVFSAPTVSLVPQGHKVGPRDDEPIGSNWAGLGVTGNVSPPSSCGVGTIVNIKMVMTVHVKSVKFEEKLLQYGFSLEADNTVLISFVLAVQNHTVHCLRNIWHKVSILALRANLADCIILILSATC